MGAEHQFSFHHPFWYPFKLRYLCYGHGLWNDVSILGIGDMQSILERVVE